MATPVAFRKKGTQALTSKRTATRQKRCCQSNDPLRLCTQKVRRNCQLLLYAVSSNRRAKSAQDCVHYRRNRRAHIHEQAHAHARRRSASFNVYSESLRSGFVVDSAITSAADDRKTESASSAIDRRARATRE